MGSSTVEVYVYLTGNYVYLAVIYVYLTDMTVHLTEALCHGSVLSVGLSGLNVLIKSTFATDGPVVLS